jgi:hypothetical protein
LQLPPCQQQPYTTNNILLECQSSAKASLDVSGCGFVRGGSYVADTGRKYIALTGNLTAPKLIGVSQTNTFMDATERPSFNGPWNVPSSTLFFGAKLNGTTVVAGHNIASVAKLATGRYTVTLNYPMPSLAYIPFGLIWGALGRSALRQKRLALSPLRSATEGETWSINRAALADSPRRSKPKGP